MQLGWTFEVLSVLAGDFHQFDCLGPAELLQVVSDGPGEVLVNRHKVAALRRDSGKRRSRVLALGFSVGSKQGREQFVLGGRKRVSDCDTPPSEAVLQVLR